MKAILLLFTALLTVFSGISQSVVYKVPLFELFSSSTCPPCKPAADHLVPIFEDYHGEIVVVEYSLNWPGAGDPYYTLEANSRKSAYGVSGIPDVYRSGTKIHYSDVDTNLINSDLDESSRMKMDLRYMIDSANQSIRVRARIEALEEYSGSGHRLLIPIFENLTKLNKETNGQTEFHNVFKKMLPEPSGDIIIGEIEKGEVIEYDTTYVFQGDYRLPASAQDPINHNIEHSVEQFNDLNVAMYMQSLVTKEIYQAALGEQEFTVENMDREWGAHRVFPTSIAELNKGKGFVAFPNPSSSYVNLAFEKSIDVTSVLIRDMQGRTVYSDNNPTITVISTEGFENGLYIIEVRAEKGVYSKQLVIEH